MTAILIVEDSPLDREALHLCLRRSGYTLVDADTGDAALTLAEAKLPDLVLLDIMLPGMHGFETARRLKKLADERFLPIILVSGLSDPSSRALGAHIGVDGYLVKPVDGAELLAAIENLLARKAEHVAMAAHNAELKEHARLREELSTLIVHDIKNPLAVVLASLDYAEDIAPPDPDLRSSLQDARGGAERILRLLSNLLDVARSESGGLTLRVQPMDVSGLFEGLHGGLAAVSRAREVRCQIAGERGLRILADVDVITRVVANILDNALRYARVGGRIELRARATGGRVQLRIGNDGPPVPEEKRPLVFEKFASSGDQRGNLGLGMYFCRLAVEAHGGRIWIESDPELPTVFVVEMPVPTV